jgi:hypothetical protein
MKYSSLNFEAKFFLGIFGIAVLIIIGWIINLFSVITSSYEILSGQLIVQLIGIVIVPLGGFMGWYSIL